MSYILCSVYKVYATIFHNAANRTCCVLPLHFCLLFLLPSIWLRQAYSYSFTSRTHPHDALTFATFNYEMTSAQFLSSYCIFSAAVAAFRSGLLPPDRSDADSKAVAKAFREATKGLAQSDLVRVTEYLNWISAQPDYVESARTQAYATEFRLDRAMARTGRELIDDGTLITATELCLRTGTAEGHLLQLVRERKIFTMPHWVEGVFGEDYYPAFFAESHYDWVSLTVVSEALLGIDGIRKFRFFTTEHTDLDNQTPLKILAAATQHGDVVELEQVLERVLLAVKEFRRRAPKLRLKL
jgi:hypothetical protein